MAPPLSKCRLMLLVVHHLFITGYTLTASPSQSPTSTPEFLDDTVDGIATIVETESYLIFEHPSPLYLPNHTTSADANLYYKPDVSIEFDMMIHDYSGSSMKYYQVFTWGDPSTPSYTFPRFRYDSSTDGRVPGLVRARWCDVVDASSSIADCSYIDHNTQLLLSPNIAYHIHIRCTMDYINMVVRFEDGTLYANRTDQASFSFDDTFLETKYGFYLGADPEVDATTAV